MEDEGERPRTFRLISLSPYIFRISVTLVIEGIPMFSFVCATQHTVKDQL